MTAALAAVPPEDAVEVMSVELVVRFKIEADGKVSSVAILADKSTLGNESVEGCIKRQFKAMKFPAKGGALVAYPLIFSPG